jgi:uncharacterized protein (DUF885 family)
VDTIRDKRPAARPRRTDHVGLTWLADGDDAYGRLIRYHTTLDDRSAGEIHETGLRADREARPRVPGARPGRSLGTDDVAEIFRRLREDPGAPP